MRLVLIADDIGSFGLATKKNFHSSVHVTLYKGKNGFEQVISALASIDPDEVRDIGIIFSPARFSVARRLAILGNIFQMLFSVRVWSQKVQIKSIDEIKNKVEQYFKRGAVDRTSGLVIPAYFSKPNITKKKKLQRYTEHISAGGYIWHNGNILLVKNHYHGGIIPPHGHVEKGETKLEAAMREICEETGYCDIQPIAYLGFATYTFFEKKALHRKREYRWLFTLRSKKRQPKQTEESESLENRWMPLHLALQKATFENTKKDLKRLPALLARKGLVKAKN